MKPLPLITLLAVTITCCNSKGNSDRFDFEAYDSMDTVTAVDTPAESAALNKNETSDDLNEENNEQIEEIRKTAITQYSIVDGPSFRGNIAQVLKNLGFKVTTHQRPDDMDDMEDFTTMEASREGYKGTTTLKMVSGEDVLLTINFANDIERDIFVESMQKAGYNSEKTLYSHPQNDLSKIYVRIKGLTAKIISPFEMLYSGF